MTLPMGHAEVLNKNLQVHIKENDYAELLKRAFVFTRMKSIIERLAPEGGVWDREMGDCYYCGSDMMINKNNTTHKLDCPWVEARKLLEELK